MTQSQRQSAIELLRNRILRGALPGGSKLRASHLAEELAFSRTPLSEALMALEAEGLLIRDRSGFTVRSFSLTEVLTAIELRGLLEAVAAQKAAEQGVPPGDLAELRDMVAAMDQVLHLEDTSGYDPLNDAFHQKLSACSQNTILTDEVTRSYRLPFAGPSAFPARVRPTARFAASLIVAQSHHHAMVDAIEERAGARAFALMQEHARLAHTNVCEAMKHQSDHPNLALVQS